jgi:putative redox protein
MPVTASARSSGDALRHEVVADGRHSVVVDEPERLGGTDTAPTPYELLAASLAGCIAITIRLYARRKAWDLGDFGVEVCLDREDQPTSCAVTLTLPDDLDDEQRERLHRVAKACPVSRTLAEGIAFEHGAPAGRT